MHGQNMGMPSPVWSPDSDIDYEKIEWTDVLAMIFGWASREMVVVI